MSSSSRLRILSVGGNAVSAFLSWRLQATNACDVTLVWKSGFENVSQYGISFRSKAFGNERFKPRAVVRSPEEAAGPPGFDYVLLCVKALPDVYDLAAVIESVVTPQLTCIILNTTNALGIESYLETRFPTNVVLSLCSGVNLSQLASSDFEHLDSSVIWVGSANQNPNIPASIQNDMAEALALTLQSGNVDCQVSDNIRQQQWEKLIGPIAFHPLSVFSDTSDLALLVELPGMRELIEALIAELLSIAQAQGCIFASDVKQQVFESMIRSVGHSTMYQDYLSRRPMEVEVLLGSPIKMADTLSIPAPRLKTLYPLLQHLNISNQAKSSPNISSSTPQHRQTSLTENLPGGTLNTGRTQPSNPSEGFQTNGRAQSGPRVPISSKRMPPNLAGRPGPNGTMSRNAQTHNGTYISRRNSFDNDLEEFGHIAMYGDMLHTDDTDDLVLAASDERHPPHPDNPNSRQSLSMRERELHLRQRELALKEQEMALQKVGRPTNKKKGSRQAAYDFDDDDDDDDDEYLGNSNPAPYVNPDNIDMMSVTSRRNRRLPSASNLRGNVDRGGHPHRTSLQGVPNNPKSRVKDRTSSTLIHDFPTPHSAINDDPLMNYSSNRYPVIQSSRTNSLTTQRMDEFGNSANMAMPQPSTSSRRASANSPFNQAFLPNQSNHGPTVGKFPAQNGRYDVVTTSKYGQK